MELNVCRPVPARFRISSPFGIRIHPITKIKSFHGGVDFACPIGTEVISVKEGKIVRAGWQDEKAHEKGFGLRVIESIHCNNNEEYYIYYGHLSDISCYEGQFIGEKGIIGLSGSSGTSTGPHLHLEARLVDTAQRMEPTFIQCEKRGKNDRTRRKKV
jgi:murein DD-endopeptidase MepM/ murein hydrolase activator NlpD